MWVPFWVSLPRIAQTKFQIDVRNANDVIAALEFTKTEQIPLTIKNTGVSAKYIQKIVKHADDHDSSTITKAEVAHQAHWPSG